MGDKNRLFEIADRQQGFFTAKQAEECGYNRSNFHLRIVAGEWSQEARGIYCLRRYPVTSRPELVLWSLWSRNRQEVLQGAWSHETALDIHELSDIMPSKMHMTVPVHFRRRAEIPKVLCFHYADLEKSDMEIRQGFKVTTPLRTLIDVVVAKTVADNLLSQAIRQALERGLVLNEEFENLKTIYPDIYLNLKGLLHDDAL